MRLRCDGSYVYDDDQRGRVVARIAHYDSPEGWVVFHALDGERVPGGPWPTADEALAAAEAALATPPGVRGRAAGG